MKQHMTLFTLVRFWRCCFLNYRPRAFFLTAIRQYAWRTILVHARVLFLTFFRFFLLSDGWPKMNHQRRENRTSNPIITIQTSPLPISSLFFPSMARLVRAVVPARTTRSLSVRRRSIMTGRPFSLRTTIREYTHHCRRKERSSERLTLGCSTGQVLTVCYVWVRHSLRQP